MNTTIMRARLLFMIIPATITRINASHQDFLSYPRYQLTYKGSSKTDQRFITMLDAYERKKQENNHKKTAVSTDFISLSIQDTHGNTMLHFAARLGKKEILQDLLEIVALSKNRYGKSPLWYAIRFQHRECAFLLLEKCNDISLACDKLWYPLTTVIEEYDTRENTAIMIDLLLSHHYGTL